MPIILVFLAVLVIVGQMHLTLALLIGGSLIAMALVIWAAIFGWPATR